MNKEEIFAKHFECKITDIHSRGFSWAALAAMEEYAQQTSIQGLIDRNYNATKERGQINDETIGDDFIVKINEEAEELEASYMYNFVDKSETFDLKELADIILVCFSMAKHFNIDIMQVLSDKVEYNETRKD